MNKKWMRMLALCLAAVCLMGAVAAVSTDLNSDGKTNAWDLQLAVKEGKTAEEKLAVLQGVLGGADELRPNAEGVYEIASVMGIKNMINLATTGASFKLVKDIDLQGETWKPLNFSGQFDGNGHTISNVKITESTHNGSLYAMGFFSTLFQYEAGGEKVQTQVKNLHLENVEIIADTNAQYIGLLAGTNKGIVENCTATGSVTDNRTQLAKDVRVGALVGCNENTTPASQLIKGTDLLTATAGTGNADDKVEGVSAKLATFYAPLDEGQTAKRYTGIVGYGKETSMSSDMIWQDTSNSTAYKTQAEQTRRNTVVAEMYKMGTVEWTPSETVTFTRFGNSKLLHSNAYVAGKTYTGIPYVGARDGSYERFMSQMQAAKDSQGRYVTVKGLKDGTQSDTYAYDGFVTMMGSSCHWAVIWSWATVSPNRTENNYGGVAVNTLQQMIPTAANVTDRGALPVGGYTVADGLDADVEATQKIIASNGLSAMAECYAQAAKGDAIVFRGLTLGGKEDGHTQLLAQDPVIIRKGASPNGSAPINTIDRDRSYIQYHGQGDGLSDGSGETYTDSQGRTYEIKYTSWRLNKKVTLTALLTKEGAQAAGDTGYWGFIPVTIHAFSAPANFEKNKAPYYNVSGSDAVTMPNTGKYYSNYKNVSATMIIKDADGNTVYEKTSYMMATTVTPNVFYEPNLSQLFPDADDALTAGQNYTATLKFKTANGTETVPYVDKNKTALFENYAFTYGE